MMIYCFADSAKSKSKRICKMFAAGCNARYALDAAMMPDNIISFFYGVTPRQIDLWRKVKGPFMWADNSYLPTNTEMLRITANAFQIDGTGKGNIDRAREFLPPLKPWRRNGRNILLCLQSEHHHFINGVPRNDWIRSTVKTLRASTNRPIIIRDKPLRRPDEVEFEEALKDAWAVVTFNSRVANEAIVGGVPAFVSTVCASSPMANSDLTKIENPDRPDGREEWLGVLAANQWTVNEIMDGKAWQMLRMKI